MRWMRNIELSSSENVTIERIDAAMRKKNSKKGMIERESRPKAKKAGVWGLKHAETRRQNGASRSGPGIKVTRDNPGL